MEATQTLPSPPPLGWPPEASTNTDCERLNTLHVEARAPHHTACKRSYMLHPSIHPSIRRISDQDSLFFDRFAKLAKIDEQRIKSKKPIVGNQLQNTRVSNNF
jgi:hypothetical protein